VQLADGGSVAAVAVIWATGLIGAPFLAASGLACDAAGCVRVDAALRSLNHPFVFAAGDCASLDPPRPKAGVWAVRAGPPLETNLRRAIAGRPLRPWRPQRRALAILGLGGGRALAWRGGLSLHGRLAWAWKDRLDRRWVARYLGITREAG
jgi:selenide,water dikinase